MTAILRRLTSNQHGRRTASPRWSVERREEGPDSVEEPRGVAAMDVVTDAGHRDESTVG